MEAIFWYAAKVIFTCGVMFLYYQLFLKDKTFHHYNRFYLLATMGVGLVLPLLETKYFTVELHPSMYLLWNNVKELPAKNLNYDFPYYQYFAFGIGLVAVFFLLKLVLGIFKIQRFKSSFPKSKIQGIDVYQTDIEDAPFSFFRNLFWKNSILLSSDLGQQILKHEIVHIEQKHSYDKIFTEILCSIMWFNPFFHLIKREISLIHEYLADKKALNSSDTKAFAQMLLASRFSGKPIPATSPFFNSNLKKRLTMLKKPTSKQSYVRRLFALPLLFALIFSYMVNAENKEILLLNNEVEKLIKQDTIIPVPPVPPVNTAEIPPIKKLPESKSLKKESLKAQKLTEVLKSKSQELAKLKNLNQENSPEFKKLEKEMASLSADMNNLFNSEEFKASIKEMEAKVAANEAYFNSDEFKKQLKSAEEAARKAEKMVNSAEFKMKIKEAEKKAKEAEKMVNTPELQLKIKNAEKRSAEFEKEVNSPAFQAKIKAAEENAIKAEVEKPVIYIDGKLASQKDMEALPPSNIEAVYVEKKGYNGSKESSIKITTKK